MESLNKIVNHDGKFTVTLDVYVFMDEDVYIAYSPALDLSGYGTTKDEAKDPFSIVMEGYIADCITHLSIVKDLRAHGWN